MGRVLCAAQPTELVAAGKARHVIAALVLLDAHLALGTLLQPVAFALRPLRVLALLVRRLMRLLRRCALGQKAVPLQPAVEADMRSALGALHLRFEARAHHKAFAVHHRTETHILVQHQQLALLELCELFSRLGIEKLPYLLFAYLALAARIDALDLEHISILGLDAIMRLQTALAIILVATLGCEETICGFLFKANQTRLEWAVVLVQTGLAKRIVSAICGYEALCGLLFKADLTSGFVTSLFQRHKIILSGEPQSLETLRCLHLQSVVVVAVVVAVVVVVVAVVIKRQRRLRALIFNLVGRDRLV